jgi:hypothetical protein
MHAPVVHKRPWLRPHLSAIVFGCLTCAAIAFVNIPGTKDDRGRRHGWPLTYLYRVDDFPMTPAIWTLTEDVAEFRSVCLAANVAAAIGLGLVATAAFEWWRRRHGTLTRFSLRAALIAVVACSLLFAWLSHRVARWRQQRAAIVRIERAGGAVRYDSILPEWSRNMLNDRLGRPFDEVFWIDLAYTDVSDSDLKHLALLPNVRSLDLKHTRVTDAGLVHVGRLRQLNWLSLEHTAISDRGLVHLQHLTRLECLGLDETRICGSGLRHLKRLHSLEIIAIRDTPLTDDGLTHLTGLPKLWCVYTDRTKVTESGASDFEENSQKHVIVDYDWNVDDLFR